ncbi:MAG: SulP family inorganic anion transporter [Candidatus Kapabacteria bacterium]|nr:SulP family inorganic anion transporter [Ignavibacteriota bacterium]MCW5885178.1 SulP family inorganic anion transporter [Candidatus Kapabacteria bacterium]
MGIFQNLKYDLPAGLVVFLVAVPLCLGIALASGAPLFAGIIAGIIGGTVVAALSGSPLSVSGPAAGLTVIVLNAIATLGSYEAFLLSVVLAGLMQLTLGYLKAGIIGYYFPSSVIKGMLAGIGLILILKQIPHAIGYDVVVIGDESFIEPEGTTTFESLMNSFGLLNYGAAIISIISIVIMVFWEKPFFKKFTFVKLIPGALVVVILGIVTNYIFQLYFPNLVIGENMLVSLPIAESFQDFAVQFVFPDFTQITNANIWIVAVTIAIIASLESLLSLEAVDKLDPYKRTSPANQELKAQGVGNFLSGLIGGLPMTAVIVRSSANVNAGGRTKMAAIFHGILLLVSVLLIPTFLNLIPLASLAAILLLVGYKLAKWELFRDLYRMGMTQFLPFIVTVLGILFTDLLRGIGLGMAVAIFYILKNNYKTPYFFHKETHKHGEIIRLILSEDVSFLNRGSILLTLSHLPENVKVIIDGTGSQNIDYDVLEIIHDFKISSQLKNIEVELIEIPDFIKQSHH